MTLTTIALPRLAAATLAGVGLLAVSGSDVPVWLDVVFDFVALVLGLLALAFPLTERELRRLGDAVARDEAAEGRRP